MATIRVPDIAKVSMKDELSGGPPPVFDYKELEVSKQQAAKWSRLNEKEQLTLVLKADREGRDIRDYLQG
ncbi:MAG: hypothetical protein ABSG45_09975 [Nitrososphaerales archaeon]